MQRRFRHFLSSRKARLLATLALAIGAVAAMRGLDLLPRPLPRAGILVVDLRHALPDKSESWGDGQRSVSAVTILRALDAARGDRRIAGLYLRVGGRSMTLAQASEIADAVIRLRRAGKFAVAWSGGFTASHLSDRVLAAAADELWTEPGSQAEGWHPGKPIVPVPGDDPRPSLPRDQAPYWGQLVELAAERIWAAAQADGASPISSVDVVTRAADLSPTQHHRGPEAQAEQAALAWGGAGAGFVDILTYRESLDRRTRDAPIVALVQAEGVLDILEGPGPQDLAGPMVDRIRAAAADSRVKAIVVRISAVAASDEALGMVLQAARKARRGGTPVGISFGPVIPSGAAALRADIPISAPEGALLVNLAPGVRAVALAEGLRYRWPAATAQMSVADLPAEAAFLRAGTAVAAVTTGDAPGAASKDLPEAVTNPVPDRSAPGRPGKFAWRNQVGSLLDMKDRLTGGQMADGGRPLLLAPYEKQPSVWSRTKARLAQLWKATTGFLTDSPGERAHRSGGPAKP